MGPGEARDGEAARAAGGPRRLDGMAPRGTHQGVAWRRGGAPARRLDDLLDELDGAALLLALDGVQDPHNLGACLRVADAAGCQR